MFKMKRKQNSTHVDHLDGTLYHLKLYTAFVIVGKYDLK